MSRISQREARRLQKQVSELMEQEAARRRSWSQEWFGGVNIVTIEYQPMDSAPVAVRTARKLGHAVVVLGDDTGRLRFMALPIA